MPMIVLTSVLSFQDTEYKAVKSLKLKYLQKFLVVGDLNKLVLTCPAGLRPQMFV